MSSTKSSRPPLVPPERVLRRFAATLPAGPALAIEVLFALRVGVQGVDKALSRWMGRDAMTPGRWQVLVVLWSADHPLPQREIVAALQVSRATVSSLIETLAAEGHVAMAVDPADRRRALVTLTTAGRALTERLVQDNAERLRHTFDALSDDELKQLAGLLGRLLA